MILKFGKKEYRPHPGWAAIKHYCALHNPPVEFYEAFDHFKSVKFDNPTNAMLDDFGLLLWCFIDRGCKVDGKDNELTVDDVIDYIGQTKDISSLVILLYQSYGVDVEHIKKKADNKVTKAENEVTKAENEVKKKA